MKTNLDFDKAFDYDLEVIKTNKAKTFRPHMSATSTSKNQNLQH